MTSLIGGPTSEYAWLEEICGGRFKSRDGDGNAEVAVCEMPTAGETYVTTWHNIISNRELCLLPILERNGQAVRKMLSLCPWLLHLSSPQAC
jgi:hypothetical protein